jgi:transcriptional regulator with XRE-family HTH domain
MNINIHQRVGARIRAARILRGITATEVGRCIGVSYQQIWKYEIGKSSISVDAITAIAQLLRMPISFFLEEAAIPFDMATSDSSGRVVLLDAYDRLDPARRDLLISIAEALGGAGGEHRLLAAE